MTLDSLPRIAASAVPAATSAQMAEADRVASETLGIPLEWLMENAARQIAAAARAFLGDLDGQIVAAAVGTGNNGGDALGALRHLLGWGAQVDAFVAGPPDRLRPLARRQYDILKALEVPLYDTTTLDDGFLVHRLRGRNLILDGLLGYSARGAPRDEIARLIGVTSAASTGVALPILAVDLPSGIDPDTGEPLSTAADRAIHAALTVTLALPKTGLLRDAARAHVGELILADIGIPAKAYEAAGIDARSVFAAGDLLRIVS